MKRSLVLAFTVLTAIAAASIVRADGPQFRDTVTVRGMVSGSHGEHHLTFSGPVALPGIALGAGTYIFSRPSTNVLRVTSAGRKPYALLLTLPAARAGATDAYQIVLGPPAAPGSPRRIEAWFLPGESTGQQLIYPKK